MTRGNLDFARPTLTSYDSNIRSTATPSSSSRPSIRYPSPNADPPHHHHVTLKALRRHQRDEKALRRHQRRRVSTIRILAVTPPGSTNLLFVMIIHSITLSPTQSGLSHLIHIKIYYSACNVWCSVISFLAVPQRQVAIGSVELSS
jgi:hypothetical protein